MAELLQSQVAAQARLDEERAKKAKLQETFARMSPFRGLGTGSQNSSFSPVTNLFTKGVDKSISKAQSELDRANRQAALVGSDAVNLDKRILDGLAKSDMLLGNDAFKSMMDQRSDAKKEISDMRREQTRGLSAQQNQSARAMYENTLRNSGATQRGALASNLASRGLQGGFAAAQSAGLESALANQMNQAGNQLMMQDVNLRAQGLNAYENTVGDQEQEARTQLLNRLAMGEGELAKALELQASRNAGKSDILGGLGSLLGL